MAEPIPAEDVLEDAIEEIAPRDAVEQIKEALDEGDTREVDIVLENLHAADKAEVITMLPSDLRIELVEHMVSELCPEEFDSEILPYLEGDVASQVIETLGLEQSADAIQQLETDDALSIIEELKTAAQEELIGALPARLSGEVAEGLTFAEESAGRLMRRELVSVPDFWTVGHAIDFMRKQESLPESFYIIYTVDARYHVTGRVLLAKLMRSKRATPLSELAEKEVYSVHPDTDQEEVAYMFRKYALVEAPVANSEGRLLGTITVDDVVDVIQEEEEEDFLRAGGLRALDLNTAIFATIRQRFPWLLINLGTAILASMVIGAYSETIEQLVALAVLMPIVASMGGNAGTQSVTIAVRALATKELRNSNALRTVRKEFLVGTVNGLLFAVIAAAGAYLWFGDAQLSLVLAGATIGTLMLAGLSGAVIPLALNKLKLDPAVASGIFLTTVTDVVGFFSFLGLAAWLML